MDELLEQEIQQLEAHFLSDDDPMGRGFVPLADAFRRAGVFDRARELLTEGLSAHPGFASGHLVSGWVHREMGETEAALSDFRKVLDLDPTNVLALRGIGEMEQERGNHGPALECFRALAEIEDSNVEVAERVRSLTALVTAEGGVVEVEPVPPPPEPPSPEVPEFEAVAPTEEPSEAEVPGLEPEAPTEELTAVEVAGFEPEPAPEATPALEVVGPEGEAVPVESLAPDAVGPEAEVVPVESLAPDAGDPEAAAVPVELLAPDAVRPGEAASPEVTLEEATPNALTAAAFAAAAEAFEMGEDAAQAASDFQLPGRQEGRADDAGGVLAEAAGIPTEGLPTARATDPVQDLADRVAADGSGDVVTRTMAEVYARQGLYDRAVEVYDRLIRAEPGVESLVARRDELLALSAPGTADEAVPIARLAADDGDAVPIQLLAPDAPDTHT